SPRSTGARGARFPEAEFRALKDPATGGCRDAAEMKHLSLRGGNCLVRVVSRGLKLATNFIPQRPSPPAPLPGVPGRGEPVFPKGIGLNDFGPSLSAGEGV